MKAFVVCAVLAGLTALGMEAGCSDLGVGRKCLNAGASDQDAGVQGTTISSPSLECLSRLCYLQPVMNAPDHAYCTAKCTTDSDCRGGLVGMTAGLCQSSFVCAIPSSNGKFACQQFCVCKDDLLPSVNTDPVDGGVICPPGCASGPMGNRCPNGT